jgi:hypothetical protein
MSLRQSKQPYNGQGMQMRRCTERKDRSEYAGRDGLQENNKMQVSPDFAGIAPLVFLKDPF